MAQLARAIKEAAAAGYASLHVEIDATGTVRITATRSSDALGDDLDAELDRFEAQCGSR